MEAKESAQGSKRKRGNDDTDEQSSTADSATTNSSSSALGIVGLKFTDSRVLYCHRSTLVNAGGYFAACFGDNGVPATELTKDEHGISVFFVERNAALFDLHILPYILTKRPGKLPAFLEDPELWRLLRDEALFYGLDDLSEFLHVTHYCPYSPGNDKGVLHWLGTRKGKTSYQNPYTIGAVNVTVGGIVDATYKEMREIFDGADDSIVISRAFTPESRQALLQYRPAVYGLDEEQNAFYCAALNHCFSLWCQMSTYKFPTVVKLVSVKLRLAAFSLRYDQHGMTDWNLEGSEDGIEWTVLHEARNDHRIAKTGASLEARWASDIRMCVTIAQKEAVTLEFVEREARGTWHLSPVSDTFYQYFRIIGSGTDYERSEGSSTCLHGVGLELYGDIHEE